MNNLPTLLQAFDALWFHKKLSYCRETAKQGAIVLAKSGMQLGDNILRTL